MSRAVNSAKYQGADCTTDISLQPKKKGGMAAFFKPVASPKQQQQQTKEIKGELKVKAAHPAAVPSIAGAAAGATSSSTVAAVALPEVAAEGHHHQQRAEGPLGYWLRPCGLGVSNSSGPVSIHIDYENSGVATLLGRGGCNGECDRLMDGLVTDNRVSRDQLKVWISGGTVRVRTTGTNASGMLL